MLYYKIQNITESHTVPIWWFWFKLGRPFKLGLDWFFFFGLGPSNPKHLDLNKYLEIFGSDLDWYSSGSDRNKFIIKINVKYL